MKYETTMYIRNDLLEKIDEAAIRLQCSRSALVSKLIMKYMKRNRAGKKIYAKLKYQDGSTIGFSTKSLCLDMDVYELWGDVRRGFKFSGSLVIALAIDLYLDDMLDGNQKSDNYGNIYLSMTKYFEKESVYLTLWGIPKRKKRKKELEITKNHIEASQ